jgi:hypothetical protein
VSLPGERLARDVRTDVGRGERPACAGCGHQDQPPTTAGELEAWRPTVELVNTGGQFVPLCAACRAALEVG